jgi:hypothetical protein
LLLEFDVVATAATVCGPPLSRVAVGLARVAMAVPAFFKVAEIAGDPENVPEGTSTKFVTATMPPDGMLKASAKFGVWVKVTLLGTT